MLAAETGTEGSSATISTEEELTTQLDEVTGRIDNLMTFFSESGLADLAQKAAPLIAAAATAIDVLAVATKKGRRDFSLDTLAPEQKQQLEDKIYLRAFDLAANDSEVDADGVIDPKKGFLKLDAKALPITARE